MVKVSRLSNRKKLLVLILLTDPENDQFPELLSSSYSNCAGIYAWYALNWVLLDKQRLSSLLSNAHINDRARVAIQMAIEAGRCVDEISSILGHESCTRASLAISQHGSLKQRISLVEKMPPAEAESLVCGSKSEVLLQSIAWARSIDV